MEEKHVMDIMIPLNDYAVVSQDATIKEALKIMKESSGGSRRKSTGIRGYWSRMRRGISWENSPMPIS